MDFVSPIEVAKKVIDGIYDGVTHRGAGQPGRRNGRLAHHQAPGLRHSGGPHCGEQPAQGDLQVVLVSTMKRLYTYEDPKNGDNASLLAKDVWEVIHKNAAHPGLGHYLRPGLQLRLLRLQDAGAQLPAAPGGQGGGAAPAHADARVGGHPQGGHRLGYQNLQPAERAVVYPRHAHAVQRRHAEAADVELLPADDEGRLH